VGEVYRTGAASRVR